jgi:hypothetical protein
MSGKRPEVSKSILSARADAQHPWTAIVESCNAQIKMHAQSFYKDLRFSVAAWSLDNKRKCIILFALLCLSLLFCSSIVYIIRKDAWCAADGLIASQSNTNGSPCQQDEDSKGGEIQMYPGPSLPKVCHGVLIIIVKSVQVKYHDHCLDCTNQWTYGI